MCACGDGLIIYIFEGLDHKVDRSDPTLRSGKFGLRVG
jgi:hypothetical protein